MSSCLDTSVVLQFQEYFEATENTKNPHTFRPFVEKGRGFPGVLGVAGLDYRWEKEAKIENSARESGGVAEKLKFWARTIRQIKWLGSD